VIDGATRAKITTINGKTYNASYVARYNAKADIALIAAELGSDEIAPLPLQGSFPDVGTHVVVIGNPEGLSGTVAEGIIAGLREDESLPWLQMTAPISHGSSGSPVLTQSGSVIGVSTMAWKEGQSLNFARPAILIQGLMANIHTSGRPGSLALVAADREQVLRSEPDYDSAFQALKRGDASVALHNLRALIERFPNTALLYLKLAVAFGMKSDFKHALEAAKYAVDLQPRNPVMWENLGLWYESAGMNAEANAAFERAKTLNTTQVTDSSE
jgi:hypothetical protein